jgi:N-acetylglucosaminyldiphosphoundecaprenol N-acetyl-beta-D-mannosaminyltransferase
MLSFLKRKLTRMRYKHATYKFIRMKQKLLTIEVSGINYSSATGHVKNWAQASLSRCICVANVHTLMEAWDSPKFAAMVNSADLVTPDGMPLVWMMRAKGRREQERVYGPTLMLHLLEIAARENLPVGFYGSRPEVLDVLVTRFQAYYESLKVAYSYSPPFNAASPEEDRAIVEQINQSGVRILFVGLGCPKQEVWMAEHRGLVNAVMLGVGAAFDFHAGVKAQAPVWMQRVGLEWLFRLFTEPRRLWKRYLYHNPRFILLAVADLLGLLKRAY